MTNTFSNEKINAVIYARYSSDKQNEQSIEGQIEVCRRYAEQNGYNIIKEYADRAISGRRFDRPQFQKMFYDSNSKEFQTILVYKFDRFGRNKDEVSVARTALKKKGVKVISATEMLPDDNSAILLESIYDAIAEMYVLGLSENVRRGMNQNAEKCISNGGSIPFGYKTVDKKYVVDEETAKYVPIIFEKFKDGESIKDIINYLSELGIKNSKGNKIGYNGIHTILKNRKYLGIYRFDGYEVPDSIPRLVSDALFYEVQKQMEKNKHHRTRNKAKEKYVLTTKLYCGHCKSMMVGFSANSHTGKVYRYYMCNKKEDSSCSKRKISKTLIEDFVVEKCKDLLTDKNIRLITKELLKLNKSETENVKLKSLKKELFKREKEMKNQLNSLKECDVAEVRAYIFEDMKNTETRIADIKNQISVEKMREYHFTEADITSFLSRLKNGCVEDKAYRKALIEAFVNKVYCYDDRLTLVFNIGESITTFDDFNLNEIESENIECSHLNNNDTGSPP